MNKPHSLQATHPDTLQGDPCETIAAARQTAERSAPGSVEPAARRARSWRLLYVLAAACLFSGTIQCTGHADARNTCDPAAVRVLQQMADAYSQLTALQQETEFYSALTPLVPTGAANSTPAVQAPAAPEQSEVQTPDAPPLAHRSDPKKLDRRLKLAFYAPNRLRMEIEEKDDAGEVKRSSWVSDGKFFWTYSPEKNLYSKEKAPARIQEFARLSHLNSGCLEMLMLMGVNPFAQIEEQAEGVHLGGTAAVNGVAVTIVTLQSDLGTQATETRLYIGTDDHLLYRLVSETVPKVVAPRRTGVGSPLDELAPPSDPNPPAQPLNEGDVPAVPGVPMRSVVSYENRIDTAPQFEPSAFQYAPPEKALFLNTPDAHVKPLTLKQRIAELSRSLGKENKKRKPKVFRF